MMQSLAKLQEDEPPKKKTRTINVNSEKRGVEERTSWKHQSFLSKMVYCEKYEELENEKPRSMDRRQ